MTPTTWGSQADAGWGERLAGCSSRNPLEGGARPMGGGACGKEKWMLRGSAGARGGESARLAALWPRPGAGGKAGPPGSSLTGAGLSPERGDGVDFTLLSWFLGGSGRRRNMALVGNGAELEADEDIFEDALETISMPSCADMATSSHSFASCHVKQESGQHRSSNVSRSSSVKMDLESGLEECAVALNLFLNNKFTDALELLQPWAKNSMYHALGYSTIVVLQAIMTFEQQDIQNGISAMKDALQTCQKYRKKCTVVESFSSFLSRGSLEQMTEEEMHAEICYAECLLQKAALTFVQDENMINFIKGGMKIRTSYQIYKCTTESCFVIQYDNMFALMLSLLPARIIRLLEFIGFSGNRELGLLQLREGASGRSMRSPLCCLTMLAFHTYISLILGTGEVNLVEAESLLAPFLQQFPNGAIMLFYHARIELLKGNVEKAQEVFRKCITVQEEWKQFHHLCYWELMWIYVFQQNWMKAYYYSDLLCKESKWSKSTSQFGLAIFPVLESPKWLVAAVSNSTVLEFTLLIVRAFRLDFIKSEMMYIWNGFPVVCKRKDLSENLLLTIEKAEATIQNGNFSDYSVDDECLVKLLKGCCLKNLQRPLQAELCFNHVIQSEKLLKFDHYLVPFTLFELAFLYKSQGEIDKAIKALETARNNYKDYSMESRLHFRIQAALHLWKRPPSD
ncbi:LOW QUALITY PROTEIN: tetratricopeptide repeat protein 39B [Pteropus vampyrus]|uniref:Tetratricopeptide repeat protein 39B n=1 Tax=Pteropus vampyrus TaxID=132908 RepID=A0A6P3QV56_PTEVA|nr:LOW QUALITY PROTEIN: tetratricopeptide repeat protein 39B [Pteropus vampyrus]